MSIFYLLTKDLGFGPSLIGILDCSVDNSSFKYLFGGKDFPEYHFMINGLSDPLKEYKNEEVNKYILSWLIPDKGSKESYYFESYFGDNFVNKSKCEFLDVLYDFYISKDIHIHHPRETFYLYKELPEKVIRYDG